MKTFRKYLKVASLISVIVLPITFYQQVVSKYQFEKDYGNEWGLADKSSTLTAKRQHIDKFIENLERDKSKFATNNAIFLKTPSNNFEANLTALKTLQERLGIVEKMDPESFQYNTAIQQITQQEQGEAHEMIGVIQGCYYLNNYPMAWDWIFDILISVGIIFGIGSSAFLLITYGED